METINGIAVDVQGKLMVAEVFHLFYKNREKPCHITELEPLDLGLFSSRKAAEIHILKLIEENPEFYQPEHFSLKEKPGFSLHKTPRKGGFCE
jgi:hypothetical protein